MTQTMTKRVACGRCSREAGEAVYHGSAQEVRECYGVTAAPAVRTAPRVGAASARQIQFIKDLAAQLGEANATAAAEIDYSQLTGGMEGTASAMITALKDEVNRRKAAGIKPAAAKGEAPEGFHYVGPDDGTGTIYKVQVAHHGSGKKYAKKLVRLDRGDMTMGEILEKYGKKGASSWEYVGRGPLQDLNEDTLMTYEQAVAFGKLYGCCGRCGAILTDEDSIAAGIGPVCAKQFGR